METKALDRYLSAPPRHLPKQEALPHLGGLALHPYRGELPDEVEHFTPGPLEDAFDAGAVKQVMKHALGIERVRARVNAGRVMPIGVSRRGDPARKELYEYLVVAYDYSTNTTVEVVLDSKHELVEVREAQYQPPPVEEEIARAIQLASADDRISKHIGELVASVIPYEGADGEFAARRVVEVVFGCRSERLPKYRAWVDLGSDTVLHAGDGCSCCDRKEGEAS